MLAKQPEAMQLRYPQTLTQVAGDRGSTIVFRCRRRGFRR